MTLEANSTSEKRKTSMQRWKIVYAVLLVLTLLFAFVFQFGNIGWFVIILGLLYLIAFAMHTAFWGIFIIAKKSVGGGSHLLFGLNNLLFLIGNVLNIDFGDVNSYMFFMQYTDPPDFLPMIGYVAYGLWLVMLLILFVWQLIVFIKNRSTLSETH